MKLDARQLGGFYLPLVAAATLLVWFVVGQVPRAPGRTRLMVLIVTTSRELPRHEPVWKQGTTQDAQGYVELLSAANIPFEVMWMDDITFNIRPRYLVEEDLRRYSTIVLATPARNLKDRSVEVLLQASKQYGISLLAAGDAVDSRLRLAFGIEEIRRDRPAPERVKALSWATARHGAAGAPIEIVHRFGRAVNYYFTLGGRGFLDGYGPVQEWVREAILANAGYGMVWTSLGGVAALRMDDAMFGGSAFLQDRRWPGALHVRMDEAVWERVLSVLARHGAAMSVGIVTGYVDDGDDVRGALYRRGERLGRRRCGDVHDSREMLYVDQAGPRPGRRYDFAGEYRALLEGVREGLLTPEVHGFTHVTPDRRGWCGAEDRFSNFDWLMELAPQRGNPTTLADQRKILEEGTRRVIDWFGIVPSTLVPPSHGMNEETEVAARDFGFRALDAVFLSILRPDRVIQNGKIKTFWAHWGDDGLTGAPLEAGYPFVVGLHDRELVRRGPEWFDRFLGRWRALGVKRFVTLRYLVAHLLSRLQASSETDALTIVVEPVEMGVATADPGARRLDVPLRLKVRLPADRTVEGVEIDGHPWEQFAVKENELEIRLPAPGAQERQMLRVSLAG